MAENSHHLPDTRDPDARHEHRDVNAWMVGKFGIALALLCIVALGLLLGLFHYFQSVVGGEARVTAITLPAPPTLETNEPRELKAIREAEDHVLDSYGWVDQSKGIVRIPIARAIDLLAGRGLPSRPQSAIPPPNDASVPTESGLGPKMLPEGGPLPGGPK